MTYDELMELKRLTMNVRDKGRRSPEVLEAIDRLDCALTRIANEQTKATLAGQRAVAVIRHGLDQLGEFPMTRIQAD